MTESIIKELIYFGKNGKADFFDNEDLETIYFGGGTPSVLPINDIKRIIETIQNNYTVSETLELSLEANPDDLTKAYCNQLKQIGINRLSIGIQSFYDEHLNWMNRSHDANQAESCIANAIKSGIDNLTIDLIYGFPNLSDEQWQSNLEKANKLAINHLSCYSLTVEEKTPLKKLIETGRYLAPNEDASVNHFKMLINWAKQNNWDHYEISNFCRNGYYSKHNTSYWKQKHYLGVGPSAHSYNGLERRWNIKDNNTYIVNWNQDKPSMEVEVLSQSEKLNDYILTSLRTKWGLQLEKANEIEQLDFLNKNEALLDKFLKLDLIQMENGIITLTDDGKLYADGIASEFFN